MRLSALSLGQVLFGALRARFAAQQPSAPRRREHIGATVRNGRNAKKRANLAAWRITRAQQVATYAHEREVGGPKAGRAPKYKRIRTGV